MTTQTRTLTEAEFVSLPAGLEVGRNERHHGIDAFTTTATMLEAAGYGHSDALSHVSALLAGARAEAAADAGRLLDELDLNEMTPDDAARAVRQTSLLLLRAATSQPAGRALQMFEQRLAPAAHEAFTALADEAVTNMRRDFDAAIRAVTKAHKAGVTPEHTAAQIAEEGTPEQIAAFRGLGAAVSTLDRVAGLRIRIANLLYRGDTDQANNWPDANDHVMASFLDPATTGIDREGALNLFVGDRESVLVQPRHPGVGPSVHSVARKRLGGAWLTLVRSGYRLTLNTPTEVRTALDMEGGAA